LASPERTLVNDARASAGLLAAGQVRPRTYPLSSIVYENSASTKRPESNLSRAAAKLSGARLIGVVGTPRNARVSRRRQLLRTQQPETGFAEITLAITRPIVYTGSFALCGMRYYPWIAASPRLASLLSETIIRNASRVGDTRRIHQAKNVPTRHMCGVVLQRKQDDRAYLSLALALLFQLVAFAAA